MRIVIFGALVASLVACNEGAEKKGAQKNACCHHKTGQAHDDSPYMTELKSEIMRYHDEVMPKDPYLYELRGALEASSDSVQGLIDSVKSAQLAMHTWMKEYHPDHVTTDTTYFLSELEKVKKVNQLYKEVIPAAEKRLKK